jgi:hypothetical protein
LCSQCGPDEEEPQGSQECKQPFEIVQETLEVLRVKEQEVRWESKEYLELALLAAAAAEQAT